MTARAYTIRDLEKLTGLPRSTIHFYLREGLLPRAQKTAASRSLYTDEHLEILHAIADSKARGRTLAQIESEIQARLDEANENAVDLARQERQTMHERILAVATREFIANGYKNTHVTAIMRSLGITATLFYSHFPSKRRLLAECVAALAAWSTPHPGLPEAPTGDAAERLMRELLAQTHTFELASTAMAVLRVEGAEEDASLPLLVGDTLRAEVERIERSLDEDRTGHPRQSAFPGRLIALALIAGYQPIMLPELDEGFSRRDILEARLWLFLAAQAARNGEVDVDSRLALYQDLLSRLAAEEPPLPPELQSAQTNAIVPPSG